MSPQEQTAKHLDQMLDEMFQMEHNLIHKLSTLIDAKWDAPTIKVELEKLNKEYWEIRYEIDVLEEKQKQDGSQK